jgi:hypothetical protein
MQRATLHFVVTAASGMNKLFSKLFPLSEFLIFIRKVFSIAARELIQLAAILSDTASLTFFHDFPN